MLEEKGQLCEPSIPNSWFEERSGRRSIGSNKGRGVLAMNSGMIAALAAIAGSLVGALGSLVGTLIMQRHQDRRDLLAKRVARREGLYSDFINESVRLLVDALEHNV